LYSFTLEEKQRALEALNITVIWRPGEPPEIHGSLPIEIVPNASRVHRLKIPMLAATEGGP
jgi:hypothetical protein